MRREDGSSENLTVKRKVPVRSLQSEWILEGEREVLIVHGDQQYRLQVTRAGKLILTK